MDQLPQPYAALAFTVILSLAPLRVSTQTTSCPTAPKPKKPFSSTCGNLPKAKCEVKLGEQYLEFQLWPEAIQHCAAALALTTSSTEARACLNSAVSALRAQECHEICERLTRIEALIERKAFLAAEAEFKDLRDFEKAEQQKFGPLDSGDDKPTEETYTRLLMAKSQEWPASIPTQLGLREWVPGVVTQTSRFLAYALVAVLIWGLLRLFRVVCRYFYWRNGLICWRVSSIADETKQLAAGALMDALNVFHNPLFQPLGTSSLLSAPPGLAEMSSAAPTSLVWRNFLIDKADTSATVAREYLSDLIENIDIKKFTRHTFRQVEAFEDINLKLGIVEASLGALVRNFEGWVTKGWPTVTGSVIIETVQDASFASVRLICNYSRSHTSEQEPAPYNDDITPELLFRGERTLAVFASTRVDEYSDAVSLASQRAAFRLLYRLAKRPAEPNLAISASSYRQGVRLLLSVL